MNRYRVVREPDGWPKNLSFRVGWEGHDKDYGVGDEFDREFTETEEADNLSSGLLEIVPRKYRNIGGSTVHNVDPGETFMAALKVGEEAALVAGGHIERVELTPEQKPATKRKRKGE